MSVNGDQRTLDRAQMSDVINSYGAYHVISRGSVICSPTGGSNNYFRSPVEAGSPNVGERSDSCRREHGYDVSWVTSTEDAAPPPTPVKTSAERLGWYSAQPFPVVQRQTAWGQEMVLQSNAAWLCGNRKYVATGNDGGVLTTSPEKPDDEDLCAKADRGSYWARPVSYTHLTLPTIYSV